MKTVHEMQLRRNMAKVALLGKEVQSELEEKLTILNTAKEAGLISGGEYLAKKANLYQAYARNFPSELEELLIRKLTN